MVFKGNGKKENQSKWRTCIENVWTIYYSACTSVCRCIYACV